MTIVFSSIDYEHSLLQSIVSALVSAKHPQKLSFACTQTDPTSLIETLSQMSTIPCIPPIFSYQDTHSLSDLVLAPTAAFALYLMGPHAFCAKWDETLQKRYGLCKNKQALLTASIVRNEHNIPEAYLPTFVHTTEEACYRITASHTVLVQSLAPVPTYLVDPSAVLMPRDFVENSDTTLQTLSASAYVSQAPVFVLDEPLFCPLQKTERFLCIPQGTPLLNKRMENFQKLLGLHDLNSDSYYHTRLGFFHRQSLYPKKVPPFDWLKQRLQSSPSKEAPLLVTAIVDYPGNPKKTPLLRMHFAFLHALAQLSLLLFTQGTQETALRKMHPNALNFPNLFRRQSELLDQGMTHHQCFLRAKSQLLLRALKTNTEYTHIGWLDADSLPYPIAPGSDIRFDRLMDDRIHMATVRGLYDTSFFLMPVEKVRPLVEAIEDCTYWDLQLGRNLSEINMIHRIVTDHPDWFLLHPMPEEHLLFLSLFPSETISPGHQRMISHNEFALPRTN